MLIFSPRQTSYFAFPQESENFTCKTILCPVDLETVGLFIEGFSLSPKLAPFMAVVYTAGASREDLGNGKDSIFSLSMKQWL